MTEEELIEFAKPYLKSRGFKKKNKKWKKVEQDFTLIFFIQGSCYSKDNYYIRPGVDVNAFPPSYCYGHFFTQIDQTTPEQVMNDFEAFCNEWTDKALIKKRLSDFIQWEKRNPREKRRAGLVDRIADPVPSEVCFTVPNEVFEYALENF